MYELCNCESKLQECELNVIRLKVVNVFFKVFEKKRVMFVVFICNMNLIFFFC